MAWTIGNGQSGDFTIVAGYVHLFFNMGDGIYEGFASMIEGADIAYGSGRKRREDEIEKDPNRVGCPSSSMASQAVQGGLSEVFPEINDVIKGVPGTVSTGPPPTHPHLTELLGHGIYHEVIHQKMKDFTMGEPLKK